MSEEEEKRGLITKRLGVALAVNSLCKDNDLKSISIDDICTKVGMSRSSFYRVFCDKYDIAAWCHSLPLEEGIGQMGRTLTCTEGICTTLEGLMIFQDLFIAARNAPGIMSVREKGGVKAAQLMEDTLRECHGLTIDNRTRLALDWVADAGTSASFRWLSLSDPPSAEELASAFHACYPAFLLSYFDHPVDPQPRRPFDLANYFKRAMTS